MIAIVIAALFTALLTKHNCYTAIAIIITYGVHTTVDDIATAKRN